jgi:hypothetical protein
LRRLCLDQRIHAGQQADRYDGERERPAHIAASGDCGRASKGRRERRPRSMFGPER